MSTDSSLTRFVSRVQLGDSSQEWVAVIYERTVVCAYTCMGNRIRHFRKLGMVEGVISSIHTYASERCELSAEH